MLDLNESGEAPPAYVKELERVHMRGEREGKPPDYEEREGRM